MNAIRSDRHIYRELAKITKCKRTRRMYFLNMARVWHKEKTAVRAAAR